jgi:hypothetical protein
MGDIVRMNIEERFFEKYKDKVKEWKDAGKSLIVISGGIPELHFGSDVVLVDIDHLDCVGETDETYEECYTEY